MIRLRFDQAGRAALYGALELLVLLPYAVFIDRLSEAGRPLIFCLLLLLLSYTAAWMGVVWTKRVWPGILLGIMAGALSMFYAFGNMPSGLVWFGAGIVMAARGALSRAYAGAGWLPIAVYAAGIVGYASAAIGLALPVDHFGEYRRWIGWAGMLSLILLFADLNNKVLLNEALSRSENDRPSVSVRKANRRWTALLLAAVFGIGALRLLPEALRELWRWLIGLWPERMPAEEPPPMPERTPQRQEMFPAEPGEPFWLWVWLERLMWAAMAAAAVAALFYLGRWLWRTGLPMLVRWVKRLIARWLHPVSVEDAGPGFRDETEKLERPERIGRAFRFLKRLSGRGKQGPATNEERLRELYADAVRQAKRKGYVHQASLTPLETGRLWQRGGIRLNVAADRLVRLYSEVRYGGRKVAEEELADLRKDAADRRS